MRTLFYVNLHTFYLHLQHGKTSLLAIKTCYLIPPVIGPIFKFSLKTKNKITYISKYKLCNKRSNTGSNNN